MYITLEISHTHTHTHTQLCRGATAHQSGLIWPPHPWDRMVEDRISQGTTPQVTGDNDRVDSH